MDIHDTMIDELHRTTTVVWTLFTNDRQTLPKLKNELHTSRKKEKELTKSNLDGRSPESAGVQKAMFERDLRPGDLRDKQNWRLGTGRRRTL